MFGPGRPPFFQAIICLQVTVGLDTAAEIEWFRKDILKPATYSTNGVFQFTNLPLSFGGRLVR
jgi:hypothetical protein